MLRLPQAPPDSKEQLCLKKRRRLNLPGLELSISTFTLREAQTLSNERYNSLNIKVIFILFI